MKETWEMLHLDWSEPGAHGDLIKPDVIATLLYSADRAQSRDAYFTVSEAVGNNGWLYPCALPVVKTLLAALPNPSLPFRQDVLSVIAQIAGTPSAPDSPEVSEACLSEIRHAYWYFVYGLQFQNVELADYYVDILGCLGEHYPELRSPVQEYLKMALTRDLRECDLRLVQTTIDGLAGFPQRHTIAD